MAQSRSICIRAKPCFTDTHFIWTPRSYGQFALSLGKESLQLHFLKIQPAKYGRGYRPTTSRTLSLSNSFLRACTVCVPIFQTHLFLDSTH